MSSLRRILAVGRIELTQLLRSRITFTLLLLVPALQVLLFGFAIRPTGAEVAVAISAPDRQTLTRVEKALQEQSGFRIVVSSTATGAAEKAVTRGVAIVGIDTPTPPSFADPRPEPVRVTVDASNAALVGEAVARIETTYWQTVADGATGPGLQVTRLYNPQARADWTFLPALIGVTMMISAIMLGTLSMAKEREGGTWEALLALPLSGGEALAGKLLPHALLGTVQGLLVLGAATLIFGVPVRGNVVALIAMLPLFAATHLVIGQAIAARAATQIAALQGAVAFYLPAMLLSGFLYPFESLPHWAQTIGSLFPLKHFIVAARGVLLRGEGINLAATEALPIAAVLLVALAAASALRSRRLD